MLPDDITSRSFDGALHGYDKSQVREFLAQVADEHKAVAARVEEAESNLEVLQSRLESFDELVRTSGERCRSAEERIAELEGAESRVAELESELDARRQAVESRIVELEAELDARRQVAESRIAELEAELDAHRKAAESRILDLELELESQREALLSASAGPESVAKQIGDEVTTVLQAAVAAGQAMRSDAEAWAEQLRRDVNDEVSELRRVTQAEVADAVARGQEQLEQMRTSEATIRSWLSEAQSTIEVLLREPEVQLIEFSDSPEPEAVQDLGDWAGDVAVGTY